MYEGRRQPLLPRRAFMHRIGRSAAISTALLAVSLGVGVAGYHGIAGLGWIDAILNASMILTGMGPVSQLSGDSAKLFASAYALFSGVVFIASAGVVVVPVAHRLLHRFHVEVDDDSPERGGERARPKLSPSKSEKADKTGKPDKPDQAETIPKPAAVEKSAK